MVFKQPNSMPPFNYHSSVLHMGTSHSGSAGQILTLTHLNLRFKTKKPGRCGEANTGRRDRLQLFTPSVSLTAEKYIITCGGEFDCANNTVKSHVLYCHVLPRAIPCFTFALKDHKNRNRITASSLCLSWSAVSVLF